MTGWKGWDADDAILSVVLFVVRRLLSRCLCVGLVGRLIGLLGEDRCDEILIDWGVEWGAKILPLLWF